MAGLWVWLFPLTDPHGSAWEGGHLSSALWYLRTLLWLVLSGLVMLTIIGIPFGLQHIKLAVISLAPVGKQVVDI